MAAPDVAAAPPAAIAVDGLGKGFETHQERITTARERAAHPFRRPPGEVLEALKDVTFEVGHGEFMGIVGRNGSGKSTLLKCLSGIYRPDAGEVRVDGRIAPFIELGVGFNPELTARDNVIVNAVLLGLTPAEARARYEEVVAFSELGEFLDLKLKNYSSGMQVRLAFAVTVQVDADVLLFDEVLAVGDEAFKRKCGARFEELKSQGRTALLVTHDMEEVKRVCDRALLLEAGQIVADGKPEEIAEEYYRLNREGTLRDATPDRRPGRRETGGRRVAPVAATPRRIMDIVATLALAEFKLRYLYSKLSYLWAVARPLAMFGVIYLFVTQVAGLDRGEHFPVYLLTAIVLWTFFEQATHTAVGSLVHHEPLLRRVPLPHVAIPFSVILTAAFDLAMNLIAVAGLLVISGVEPRLSWLELPVLILLLAVVTTGVSLGLSALYVRTRDVNQIWQVATYALFFGTPIFYAVSELSDGVRPWFMANPLAAVMTEMRHALVDPAAPSAAAAIGGSARLLAPLGVTVAIAVLGLWIFRRESPRVVESL
jgi:ABC-type polysaccharide/polyol phosphate transport system ATPase subunit/ABC-type polysaccharide/polyol phosphate export permease